MKLYAKELDVLLIPTTLRCGSSVGSSIDQIAAESIAAKLFTTDLGWHKIEKYLPTTLRYGSSVGSSIDQIAAETITTKLFTTDLGWHG